MTAELHDIAEALTTLVCVRGGLEHGGQRYASGQTFRVRHEAAMHLLRSGAVDLTEAPSTNPDTKGT